MATFTVTIPDPAVTDLVAALCQQYGWTAATGVSKTQFAKNCLGTWLAGVYTDFKSSQAAASAAVTAAATAATYTSQVTVT